MENERGGGGAGKGYKSARIFQLHTRHTNVFLSFFCSEKKLRKLIFDNSIWPPRFWRNIFLPASPPFLFLFPPTHEILIACQCGIIIGFFYKRGKELRGRKEKDVTEMPSPSFTPLTYVLTGREKEEEEKKEEEEEEEVFSYHFYNTRKKNPQGEAAAASSKRTHALF